MIKNKGNFANALNELKNNKAVSHLYSEENKTKGSLSDAVITIKDNYATDDANTQGSSKVLENFKPLYNATVVQKIKDAGGSIVAKVHLDEFGLGGTGQYSAYGELEHPKFKDRLIGGSSSGSAYTFSDNIFAALGSDTGDSVRIPASYIGKVGYKPSYGAISRFGLFPFASSLDTVGYFGHNVNDIIELSNVLFGLDPMDMTSREVDKPSADIVKPKTIGVLTNVETLEKYQVDAYNDAIDKFKKDGIEVKEFTIDQNLLNALDVVYQVIAYSEAISNYSNITGISFGKAQDGKDSKEISTNTRSAGFGYMVQRRFTLGAYFLSKGHQEETFVKAKQVRRLIVEAFKEVYKQVDLLAFPAATVAPLSKEGKKNTWDSSYLIHANLAGTPSLSLPVWKHEDLTFNISLDANLYQDKKLLSHSLYIEKLLGGNNE